MLKRNFFIAAVAIVAFLPLLTVAPTAPSVRNSETESLKRESERIKDKILAGMVDFICRSEESVFKEAIQCLPAPGLGESILVGGSLKSFNVYFKGVWPKKIVS